MSADSSFDMMGSILPAGQRQRTALRSSLSGDRMTPDLFASSSISSTTIIGLQRDEMGNKLSKSCLPPLESSEDLMTSSPTVPRISSRLSQSVTRIQPSSQLQRSFCFQLDGDTRTTSDVDWMMPDVDRNQSGSKGKNLDLSLTNDLGLTASPIDDADELLGLCSGTFSKKSCDENSVGGGKTFKSLFSRGNSFVVGENSQENGREDRNELLELCSGTFSAFVDKSSSDTLSRRHVGLYTEDCSTADSDGLLHVLSGKFSKEPGASEDGEEFIHSKRTSKKRKAVIQDDDDDNDVCDNIDDEANDSFEVASPAPRNINDDSISNDDNSGDEDDEEISVHRQSKEMADEGKDGKFSGFRAGKKTGKIRQEFVEAEAELSGSELGSDDDYDIDEKEDMLEAEAGDEDDVGTEEELRNQVHRVHLKTLIDADKREIRLLQEQYLQDGDLHSDGAGRTRRFRWSNVDDDADTQDRANQSDDEDQTDADEGEIEAKWRVERLEREKFIQQQQEKEVPDESSKLFKLGHAVFRHKSSSLTNNVPTRVERLLPKNLNNVPVSPLTTVDNNKLFKIPTLSHGSFLLRSKESLAKIVELSKPIANPNAPRTSKNFVFSTVDSPEEKEKPAPQQRPVVSRSISVTPQSVTVPQFKRPRLDRSHTIPPTSIFALMD